MNRRLFSIAAIFLSLTQHPFVSSRPILRDQGRKQRNVLSVTQHLVLVSLSATITDYQISFFNIKF